MTAERKQPPKCPGSGMLDLDARSLTQSAVSQVECQECGSVRTVKFKAESVIFPSHEKLRTRTTQTGSRWVKREAGWILSTRGK